MKDFGTVESVVGKKVIIKLDKKDQKENLNFISFAENKESHDLLIKNNINAKEKDKVKVSITKRNFKPLISILYYLPILFLIGGIISGSFFENVYFNFAVILSVFALGFVISTVSVKIVKSIPRKKYAICKIEKKGSK